ncbi:MAG: WG repeat-containing protein [Psychrobacter sp.]|nr:WG repeat-containing protein [Psychrobacter sp.]
MKTLPLLLCLSALLMSTSSMAVFEGCEIRDGFVLPEDLILLTAVTPLDNCVFDSGLVAVTNRLQQGFANTDGNVVIALEYDEINPFHKGLAVVKKDGKFGMIDPLGNVIVPFEYDEIKNSSEGIISVGINVDETVGGSQIVMTHRGYLDGRGEVIVPLIYDDAQKFSEGLAAVSKNGKYGYIDSQGQTVIEFNYDYAAPFSEGLAEVTLAEQSGYINRDDKLIVPMIYDISATRGFKNGLALVTLVGRSGVIDAKGNVVIPLAYKMIRQDTEGYYWLKKDKKHQLVDANLVPITGNQYDDSLDFGDNLNVVTIGGKSGITDSLDNAVLAVDYDKIGRLNHSGLAIIQQNGLYGFIDANANVTISPQYEDVGDFFGALVEIKRSLYRIDSGLGTLASVIGGEIKHKEKLNAPLVVVTPKSDASLTYELENIDYLFGLIRVKKDGKNGVLNAAGIQILPLEYDQIALHDNGLIVATQNGKSAAFNHQGHQIIPFVYDSIEWLTIDSDDSQSQEQWSISSQQNLAKVSVNNKFGIVTQGNILVTALHYQSIEGISEGLASVKRGGKFGFINADNKVIVPFEYSTSSLFQEGLAHVSQKGNHGFINQDNELIIALDYKKAADFDNGAASVTKNGESFLIGPLGMRLNHFPEMIN